MLSSWDPHKVVEFAQVSAKGLFWKGDREAGPWTTQGERLDQGSRNGKRWSLHKRFPSWGGNLRGVGREGQWTKMKPSVPDCQTGPEGNSGWGMLGLTLNLAAQLKA